ncbi:reverse transcriptase domain-containing protein [Trichonephila clavipes]|nr:reverse transcriptase domain-containing protein [Trichonephila clavipes]
MPIKKTSKHKVPWWFIEIGCARKRLNASRRRFQRCKNPTVRELYRNNYLEYRKDYNQMLINAKSESWKKFLLTVDAQNVWKKVNTHGIKKEFTKKLTGIKLPTGETTTSLDETINAMLQKSFPSDSEENDNSFQKDYRHAARTVYPFFFYPSFSYDEVNTMVSMLKLNKSPGIFPGVWKLAQMILIPKVNEFRAPHLDNLRCISLLPALERNAINIVKFSDKSTEDFPVICYTDGSKFDGRVGFAFVVFKSGVESENFQFRIRDECTVFVAEFYV